MDSQSVHQLLTFLCQRIASTSCVSESKSSSTLPHSGNSIQCSRRSTTVKKLLSLSYEILLHKSNTRCTYAKSWNTSKDNTFEYIRDPVLELLNMATPSDTEPLTNRMYGLQNCIDNLRKLDTLNDSSTQSVIAFLLALRDSSTEDHSCNNKPGFFNTGQFHKPTYAMDGTVTPYRIYDKETFRPTLLVKSLAGQSSNGKFRYEMPDTTVFYEMPDFQSKLSRIFSRSSVGSTKDGFSSTTTAQLLNKPASSTVSQYTTSNCASSAAESDEECDIWDLAAKLPDNNLRTWESGKDFDPKKYNSHLTEVCYPSLVHILLHSEQVHRPSGPIAKLKLSVLEYSQYVSHLKFMLMGIQSTTFTFNEESKMFIIADETCVAGISPDALASSSANLITCGSYCRRLDKLTNMRQNKSSNHGPIFRELCSSVQRYLYYYKAVIIKINDKTSILSITVQLKKLTAQLEALGHLCKLDCPTELPTGVELLAYLYDEIMSYNNRGLTGIFISVLHSCVTVYLRFVERWLFDGRCDNEHSEFFIEPNQRVAKERSRLFWKSAFKMHRAAVPGFMQGLEKAVFDSGRTLHLLKLCNPSDPLLQVMDVNKPRLRFPLGPSDLTQGQTECELYYQRCIAGTGPPVTVDQLVKQSHEQQNALHERVKQVYVERHARYEAKRKVQAQMLVAAKQKQMMDWQEQCSLRTERKEREKREAEEEWQREEERDRELAYLEAERCLIEKHKAAMDLLDQKQEYLDRQLAAHQPITELSLATNESKGNVQFPEDAATTDSTTENAQQIHNNNELPTPNGNTRVGIDSFLDNCPIDQKTSENNWINMDADVQNRNLELAVRSPVCDNNAEVILTTSEASLDSRPRSESLTLELTRSISSENRRKAMGTAACLSRPYNTGGAVSRKLPPLRNAKLSELSQEKYSQMAQACSRKGSAERIRRKMLGIDELTPTRSTDYKPGIDMSPGQVPDTVKGLTRLEIKQKVLESEYGIMQTAGSDASTEGLRNRIRVLGTSEDVRGKVLDTEYHITQAASNNADTEVQKNRNKAMHSEFDLFTGVRKNPWIFRQSEPTKHEPTLEQGSVDSVQESGSSHAALALTEASALPDTPDSNRVDYLRTESLLSVSSLALTPLGTLSSMNTGSAVSTDSMSTVNPFFKTVPINRMYSYAPCAVFDKEWQQRLRRVPSNTYQKILTPEESAVDVFDMDTLDMASVNNMLKKSIILPVRTQMKLSNNALIKFFLVDQDLLSHLQSLRNYYFLLDGEFGRTVTNELFEELNRVETPRELLNPNTLNSILSRALQSSMNKDNKNVPLLSFVVKDPPAHFRFAAPHILSCLNFGYKVTWPLNIIITEEVINKYQQVFAFLLKLRRISWVLEEDFIKLKQIGKDRQYSASGQYIHVQLIRHTMSHLIHALHNYVTSTVLQESWSELQRDLKQANTLDNVYQAHVLYIKTVLIRCLLVPYGKADNFHKHIGNIFILVLKFHERLKLTGWTLNSATRQYEHPHYLHFKEIFEVFQVQARHLVHMSRKLAARGHYSHLFDLLQKLNMNNYYESLGRHS